MPAGFLARATASPRPGKDGECPPPTAGGNRAPSPGRRRLGLLRRTEGGSLPPVIALLRRHASLMVIAAIGTAAAVALWQKRGSGAVLEALLHAWDLFLFIAPSLLAGLLLAGALRQLLSPGALARWMGAESGWFGLLVATVAGTLTPGGPMAAFPLVLVLAGAGADRGALVAYILGWGLNGFQRLLVYEVPLLGPEFTAMRFLLTAWMPVLAGWGARRIPIAWEPPR